jgi:broad specificity phosphatase PhoE
MRITLVRHGETVGQSSIRYYGATDLPLSDAGREQMRSVARALRDERFDAVYSSCLCRSAEAASLVAGGRSAVRRVAGFDEVNFGRWEGWTREEIAARDGENYRLWQQQRPDFRYPGGDSRPEFEARVWSAARDLLAGAAHASLLMVLHRGVIAVLLTHLLGLAREDRARLRIDLGSIHVVSGGGAGWQAEALDRTDHLREGSPANPADSQPSTPTL